MTPRREAAAIFGVALAARLAVVAWAAGRFPPTGDGAYFDALAARLAEGHGYTWLWPDGNASFAAHYPVGYPALVASAYALVGHHVVAAMVVNAIVGAGAAVAAHALARPVSARAGIVAGIAVALHPGLVAYTPALMTEVVAGAIVVGAAAIVARVQGTKAAAVAGVVLGLGTLVRPQTLLLAPVFGAWVGPRRARSAAVALACALVVCAPWTARNCARMGRCALVSVNGGWNLLIGTNPRAAGAWAPIVVPAACEGVWDEAAKDACFERAAIEAIQAAPGAWLALVPQKLAATFDYAGAAGWYLHASNPAAFDARDKIILGAVETLFERLALLGALFAAAAGPGPRRSARWALGAVGAVCACLRPGWVGYVALVAVTALRGRGLRKDAAIATLAPAAVGATALAHAVFFGSGRYSLVVFPLVTALAALGRRGSASRL